MKATVYRGKIDVFTGSWQSGLAVLVIDGEPIHCENAPTVRALDSCFGNVIAPGHSVNQKAIHGKDIVYSLDEMGLVLEAFTPTKDWRERWGKKRTPKLGESLEIEIPGGEDEQ